MNDELFNSAMRLFSQKGYHNTNMEDIADDADVTNEMLYYHFQSKSQLFIETIIRYERQLEEKVVELASADNNPDILSYKIIKLCVDSFTDYKYIADVVMLEIQIDTDVAEEVKKVKNHFITLISYLIDEGIANGKIRNCNSRITAGSLLYFTYTYCTLLRESGTYDKEAAAVHINDILMNGMKKK